MDYILKVSYEIRIEKIFIFQKYYTTKSSKFFTDYEII
jgi:hypothetical protein